MIPENDSIIKILEFENAFLFWAFSFFMRWCLNVD